MIVHADASGAVRWEADQKVRENRARRALSRQGYRLMKCRSRNPEAQGYGQYMIANPDTNWIVAGGHPGFDLSLDDVESWLAS